MSERLTGCTLQTLEASLESWTAKKNVDCLVGPMTHQLQQQRQPETSMASSSASQSTVVPTERATIGEEVMSHDVVVIGEDDRGPFGGGPLVSSGFLLSANSVRSLEGTPSCGISSFSLFP